MIIATGSGKSERHAALQGSLISYAAPTAADPIDRPLDSE
jgi:hypothetical protein